MKNIRLAILTLTLMVICYLVYEKNSHLREEISFNQKLINNEMSLINIYHYIKVFYILNDHYPKNLTELDSVLELRKYDNQYLYLIRDPFSRDSSSYTYLPFFDRDKAKPIGFYLLSAGVDGFLNNLTKSQYQVGDTTNIKTYAGEEGYSTKNYYFGKKDIKLYSAFYDEPINRTHGIKLGIRDLKAQPDRFKNRIIAMNLLNPIEIQRMTDNIIHVTLSDNNKLKIHLSKDGFQNELDQSNFSLKGVFRKIQNDTIFLDKAFLIETK